MPGFLGGSSGSSGTGGEITFPKEFIDPVTKLRISSPENLIDTDFEYGLQPTKWETVELINNTPSFFSKSGDTTIPGITSISTNNGTREITVTTATDHGLAVGIPINVTGTKSVTADGSYVINSIPNTFTFTYLCKDEQVGNNSIEDLYTSIITGEFFQGSQIRISDAEGVTTDAEPISTLTVKTDSTHGFGLNTPFYFLNLNSTISQEFEASNTAAKSFDSSNSATAQTFDGSNTLSTFNIDWSNSSTVGGVTSTIASVNTTSDTITVTHGAETFASRPLGTPLYYNLTVPASSGYFFDNPRGVVFLKTTNALNSPVGQSTFQVSAVPDGDVIDIVSSMAGTFQLANQARTFAGNNVNPTTEAIITVIADTALQFDAANDGELSAVTGQRICTVTSYSGSLVNVTSDANNALDYYTGAMVRYTTTGSAATGLVNNTTYFVDTFFNTGTGTFSFTLKNLPGASGTAVTSISGGTGTQKFTRIGVSLDKDIVHVRNANYTSGDLLRYTYPVGGRFAVANAGEDEKNFYYVATAYDAHNFTLNSNLVLSATGGQSTYTATVGGVAYNFHRFTTVGSNNLVVTGSGLVDVLLVGGGGGGGVSLTGGGGGGSAIVATNVPVTAQTYTIVVGNGGAGGTGDQSTDTGGARGGSSTAFGITATGGGGAPNRFCASYWSGPQVQQGANGGGGSADGARPGPGSGAPGVSPTLPAGITGTVYAGFRGGDGVGNGPNYPGAGGAGSAQNGSNPGNTSSGGGNGGQGALINFDGNSWRWGGGGGGSNWCQNNTPGGAGGAGGGGGGASDWGPGSSGGGSAINSGAGGPGGGNDCGASRTGGAGGANSGGGGGGGSHSAGQGGAGGSGIVIVRYRSAG